MDCRTYALELKTPGSAAVKGFGSRQRCKVMTQHTINERVRVHDHDLAPGDRRTRAQDWPLCGARTRAGGERKVRAEPGKARCCFHGGLSTGHPGKRESPRGSAGAGRLIVPQAFLRGRHR
jgi:hypothetical protein